MKHTADLRLWRWVGMVLCGLDWNSCGLSADWRRRPHGPFTAGAPNSIEDRQPPLYRGRIALYELLAVADHLPTGYTADHGKDGADSRA